VWARPADWQRCAPSTLTVQGDHRHSHSVVGWSRRCRCREDILVKQPGVPNYRSHVPGDRTGPGHRSLPRSAGRRCGIRHRAWRAMLTRKPATPSPSHCKTARASAGVSSTNAPSESSYTHRKLCPSALWHPQALVGEPLADPTDSVVVAVATAALSDSTFPPLPAARCAVLGGIMHESQVIATGN
jgi:hypothetical protein